MAGDYIYAKTRKSAYNKLRHKAPYGSKLTISRAPSLDKGKAKKAYYYIIDIKSKSGKLLWHN